MSRALAIRNGRIWTADAARPHARSLVIAGGRVGAVDAGADGGPPGANDLEGRTVIPGLIDAHLHVLEGGISLGRLDLSRARSRAELEAAIARRHRELPAGEWMLGFGWNCEGWPEGGAPDKSWLAGAGDRPVFCTRMDMHAVLVNDAVLRLIDTSADPPGGRIVRDPRTRRPTGLLLEAAAWHLAGAHVPRPGVAARRAALRAAQQHLLAHGVTAAGAMEDASDVRDVFEPLRDELVVRYRVTLMDRGWPMDFSFSRSFRNRENLAVIGCKAFLDGTLGSRTARMLRDYDDDPGNRGLLVELGADGNLERWARAVAAEGLSPAVHAIGDEAARLALDAFESDRARFTAVRARVEHAQQVDPSDIPRFAGLVASMQPLHKADDGRYVRRRLGAERLSGTFAFRRLLRAGARLAFGSDWPVVSCDPLLGVRAAVTGLTLDGEALGQDQNLTVQEAISAYTAGSAWALRLDDAGRLVPGALGDLVVLDRDPFTADWARDPPRVAMTVIGGRVVYDAR